MMNWIRLTRAAVFIGEGWVYNKNTLFNYASKIIGKGVENWSDSLVTGRYR